MAKHKTDLLDDLVSLLPKQSRPNWMHRVPAELLEQMEAVRLGYVEGTLTGPLAAASTTGLGSAISKWLKAKGISVHESTVVRWLKK
jgi:hypothetical protein